MSPYIMKECQECGAGIPVRVDAHEVSCGFCGSTYEVERTNGQARPSPGQLGWFLGGVVVGFILGWPISRAALATVAKVSVAELEKKVEEWGRR